MSNVHVFFFFFLGGGGGGGGKGERGNYGLFIWKVNTIFFILKALYSS